MKLDAFIGVRVPAGVYAAVEAEARRQKASLSDVIRDAVNKAVAPPTPTAGGRVQ